MVAFARTITATNDRDFPVALWIDAETAVPFAPEETRTFAVFEGEHAFQVCQEEALAGDPDVCGEPESRLINEDKIWIGWAPES